MTQQQQVSDILKRAALTFGQALLAAAFVAYTSIAAGRPVNLPALTQGVLAANAAALAILWHGLPALIAGVKNTRLRKRLEQVQSLKDEIRKEIEAAQKAPPLAAPPLLYSTPIPTQGTVSVAPVTVFPSAPAAPAPPSTPEPSTVLTTVTPTEAQQTPPA